MRQCKETLPNLLSSGRPCILFVILTAFTVMEKFLSDGKYPEAMKAPDNKIRRKWDGREKAVEGLSETR